MENKTLADLKQDKKNARRHNPRNIGLIEESLRKVGAARSGVVDENGVILAGNGTYEALSSAGITKVRVVETEGDEWVVVQRKGLTEEQKRILSISDNRAADLATWDGPTLEEQGIDLQPWFTAEELKAAREKKQSGIVFDPMLPEDFTEDSPVSSKPTSAKEQYPLAIVLTVLELRRWQEYRGKRSDKEAFLALMERTTC